MKAEKSTFSILLVAQKGKLKANGKAPILARVTINGEMVHLSTRTNIEPDRWLSKEGRTLGSTKEDKAINSTLDNFRTLIHGKYNEFFFKGEIITAARLKAILTSQSSEIKRLLQLFDDFNADYEKLVGSETSYKTYTRYLLTRRRLAEFMEAKYRINDILLTDINPKFINDFYIYLRTTDGQNGHNYHMKMIQRFRTIYKVAQDNGWVTVNPFGGFKIKMEDTHRDCLTSEELALIRDKKLVSERLEKVRDLFVFSCYTGLSYADVQHLQKSDIVRGYDSKLWIDRQRIKTGNEFNVPLLDIPLAILEKYADASSKDRLLDIPSNQKVNDYLKKLAAMCGIEKPLTFHVARHSISSFSLEAS